MNAATYERAVLACAIVGQPSQLAALARLTVNDFESVVNREVWRLVRVAHLNGTQVDLVELTSALQTKYPDADRVLGAILEVRPSWGNLDGYVSAIVQYAKERRLLAATELYGRAYREQPAQFKRHVADLKSEITAIEEGRESETTEVILDRSLRSIQAMAERNMAGKLAGIPTGYKLLDDRLGGWSEGLILVIAWSNGGKTAFLVPSVFAAGNAGYRFRLYSLDMSEDDLMLRLMAYHHNLAGSITSSRRLLPEHVDQAGATAAWVLAHGSLSVKSLSVDELLADAVAYRDTFDVMFVDTFNSLRIDERNADRSEYERIAYAVPRLKELKKALGKPIIITAQAKDPPDRRESSKEIECGPTLNDIQGSRKMTQEASQVVSVWTLEYPATKSGPAKLRLAKSQRGGGTVFGVQWNHALGRFEEPRSMHRDGGERYE